jgi:hypothetical protein
MADVQTLHNALKDLLSQITPLRQEAAELQEGLDRVKRDYEPRLGELNDRREELETLMDALKAQLAGEPETPPERKSPVDDDNGVQPPEPVPDSDTQDDEKMPEPLPAVKDKREERKRDIADHIESLLSYDDWSVVMEDVNAILADPRRDVGDMLELVPWGDFWTQRAEWETPDEQLVRLVWWQEVLEGRLAHWQDELRRLKAEDHYRLWLRLKQLSRQEWLRLLDDMARMQKEENDELERQVAVLQRRLDREGQATEAQGA